MSKPGGVNARLKVPALVAGMVAGANSIDDMALLRYGATGRLFTGARAPSTLGTFLRTDSFAAARQSPPDGQPTGLLQKVTVGWIAGRR